MNRLFLDANVLFTAAHNREGKAALVISLAARDIWRVASSEHAIEEARRNLARKYPGALETFKLMLTVVRVAPQPPPGAIGTAAASVPGRASLPAKDQVILDAALGCRATHLLTGDTRHFHPLVGRSDLAGGLIVQTVSDFLIDQARGANRKV